MTVAQPPSPFYRVSIKALIFDAKRRVLVVRAKDKGWELPGGGWEHGESMHHCLRREIMEELGVGMQHINFTTIYPYSGLNRKGYRTLKLAVPGVVDGQNFRFGSEVVEAKYVTAQELAVLEMPDDEGGIKTHIDRIWSVG